MAKNNIKKIMDQAPTTNQQKQNPSSQKHYKSAWPLIIIGTLAVIIGGLIVWMAFSNSLQDQLNSMILRVHIQNPKNTPAPPAADNWKTYTNSAAGYSFEYPAKGAQLNPINSKNGEVGFFATAQYDYRVTTYYGALKSFSSLANWIADAFSTDNNINHYHKITVANQTAYVLDGNLFTYIGYNGNVYLIDAYTGPYTSTDENDSIYQHLINTFKFTK